MMWNGRAIMKNIGLAATRKSADDWEIPAELPTVLAEMSVIDDGCHISASRVFTDERTLRERQRPI
jgi:hypothetical protein